MTGPLRTTRPLRTGEANDHQLSMPTWETQARWGRCKALPPMRRGETERLVADFMTAKSITVCPPRYAAPIEQWSQIMRSRY